jgi:DNA-binding protein HU-beta
MNKSDLVDIIASSAGISKSSASDVSDAIFEGVSVSLAKGEPVSFMGFGTFYPRKRAARIGRNPKTGQPIDIKATTVVGFKAGTNLKKFVNKE